MKKAIFTLALTMFVAGTNLTSCKSTDQKKMDEAKENVEEAKQNVKEAEQNLDTAKMEYDSQYESFKNESEEKITANEDLISRLKEDAKKAKKETKVKYENAIADLEQRNDAMKTKLRDYKREGKEEWQSFKREFNHDMDELGKALEDLTKNNVK